MQPAIFNCAKIVCLLFPGRFMNKTSIYAAGKKLLGGALLFLSVFVPPAAKAAGVTIITHGADGDVTGWVSAMADSIPAYFQNRHPGFGTNFTVYTLVLTTDGKGNYFYQWSRDSGGPPTDTDTGEIIVKLDWSQMAQLGHPTIPAPTMLPRLPATSSCKPTPSPISTGTRWLNIPFI
jgi:hypothetical protein